MDYQNLLIHVIGVIHLVMFILGCLHVYLISKSIYPSQINLTFSFWFSGIVALIYIIWLFQP